MRKRRARSSRALRSTLDSMKHAMRAVAIAEFAATVVAVSSMSVGLATQAQVLQRLSDCTEELAKEFHWAKPGIPSSVRQRAIDAASDWAVDWCYLPCDFEMCGGIQEYSKTSVTVYITFRPAPNPKDFVIGPEASVTFRLPDLVVTGEKRMHSGCRSGAPDCRRW